MEFIQDACPSQVTVQTVAHTYGEMILASRLNSTYTNITEVLESKQAHQYYHRKIRNQQQVTYRFKEYNPKDVRKVYPYFTDRYITAEARNCITYHETGRDNKDPQNFTYTNANDAKDTGTITIPKHSLGREGTTYIYRGFHDPTVADQQSCGPRRLWMWAYKNPSGHPKNPSGDPKAPPEPSAFYKCPVNISEVINADPNQPKHFVPDEVAKMAAASIAMQGQYSGPPGNRSEQDYHSYRFYASGSAWEVHHKDADEVGDRFALFALGSLANMAALNPPIQIPGTVPYLWSQS
ncbi:hypothetical protein EPUS_05667 [Endocarpon pusillum Z07020]|uniref:Uncharacterized protein n=1 Tax=Endocarpon pusillum (strain Z07020 / HMAS-L-300199) TaxID=1263415 RepID=U1G966_ENDPU|nr:uncharacterized protein EPUS_05667 [Endocarpon pusillum Z07020]ERF68528.1 hypothetical protein EPUS_05667 [Endocarpon pusillum Z07020]